MAEKLNIRLANVNDTQKLLDIYAEYIKTPITFETELPSAAEFKERIAEISAVYPYLVCEQDGEIIGYAYVHRFRERAAYDWGVEASIYLAKKAVGQGLGTLLYQALIDICREMGILTIYGCVTAPNAPSEHLHAKMGFRHVGTMAKAGFKAGAWHEVNWYEKALGDYPANPQKICPITELTPQKLTRIISAINDKANSGEQK